MFKSKLQELCQRRSWELPDYSTLREGPDHMPRFTGTVTIHGQLFQTPGQCKSSKEAQNAAAQIAFDYFNAPFSPPPTSAPQFLGVSPAAPPPAVVPVAQIPVSQPSAEAPIHPLQGVINSAVVTPSVQLSQFQGLNSAAPPPSVSPFDQPPQVQPAALLPLSPLPSSLPNPPGLLVTKNVNADTTPHTSMVYRVAAGSHDQHNQGTLHMYKNQLQQFAQKNNFSLPAYTTETEGPPHARRFKSNVTVEGKLYETFEFFPALKEAEQAAAKVACQMLLVNVTQEDEGLYKNLLQELAQKRDMLCPSYETTKSGLPHMPLFVSTVEVGGLMVKGAEAKTRKQAEMNAAKAAYGALMYSDSAVADSNVTSTREYSVADNFSMNILPSAIMKKHQGPTVEEDIHLVHTKRAKSSPENTDVNSNHLPGHPPPPEGNSVFSVSTLHPQAAEEGQPSHFSKTVVCPRSVPQPECASLFPYSDDQWVAYNVNQDR